jgi:hypothetical protein
MYVMWDGPGTGLTLYASDPTVRGAPGRPIRHPSASGPFATLRAAEKAAHAFAAVGRDPQVTVTGSARPWITRERVRPEDRAAYDFIQEFDARIAKILAANGGEVICPRCRKPALGWPLKLPGDRCRSKDAVACMRDPEVVLADIARRKGRSR